MPRSTGVLESAMAHQQDGFKIDSARGVPPVPIVQPTHERDARATTVRTAVFQDPTLGIFGAFAGRIWLTGKVWPPRPPKPVNVTRSHSSPFSRRTASGDCAIWWARWHSTEFPCWP